MLLRLKRKYSRTRSASQAIGTPAVFPNWGVRRGRVLRPKPLERFVATAREERVRHLEDMCHAHDASVACIASLMDENVRSNQEEIRHFPCGTNPLPIRTRAEILPE